MARKWWKEEGGWNISLSQVGTGGEDQHFSCFLSELSTGHSRAAQSAALHGLFSVCDISLVISLHFIGLA